MAFTFSLAFFVSARVLDRNVKDLVQVSVATAKSCQHLQVYFSDLFSPALQTCSLLCPGSFRPLYPALRLHCSLAFFLGSVALDVFVFRSEVGYSQAWLAQAYNFLYDV